MAGHLLSQGACRDPIAVGNSGHDVIHPDV